MALWPPYGIVVQAGLPESFGRALYSVVALALLAATWRFRSFALAVATALVVSPIVWLDYSALAAIPLAIARPRLSPVWFVALATVGLEGAGLAIGDVLGTTRALIAFAIVLAVAFRAEQAGQPARLTRESGLRTSAAARLGQPHRPVHLDEL